MAFIHISQFKPSDHSGGVSVFARSLGQAIPDLEYLAHGMVREPWNAVESINQRFLSDGDISPDDTVIVDGYYGMGLGGRVKRLISVCHGTYAGWVRDFLMRPHPDLDASLPWFTKAAQEQEKAYREADEIVSVCTSAQEELWDFYRIDSKLVLNGVDVNEFRPGNGMGGIVEVAGSDIGKGVDIMHDLRGRGARIIQQLGFEGDKGDRWRRYSVVVLPSRHEAGSYAQLEAMASNLRIVTSYTGFFKSDVPRELFYGTDDFYWGTFNRLIDDALLDGDRDIRSWVLNNATMDHFVDGWRGVVGLKQD